MRVSVQLLVLVFILASFYSFCRFFMWRWGCSFFAAFTAFVLFYGVFELDVCGIMRRSGWLRCSVYGALGLDVLWRLQGLYCLWSVLG